MSTTPLKSNKHKVANISGNFHKDSKWPNGILRGPGETDSYKESRKSRVRLPLRPDILGLYPLLAPVFDVPELGAPDHVDEEVG